MNKSNETILKLTSLIALGIAVLGLVFLILNNNLLSVNPIGLFIQICMVGLMIWARFTFGFRSFHAAANTTKGNLVTNGPYHWLRHPIYAAIIYFVWAGILTQLNINAVIAAFAITTGLIVRMIIEEKFLNTAYSEYKSYSEKTVRLIPFLF